MFSKIIFTSLSLLSIPSFALLASILELESMSLEEKAGQVLMAGFLGAAANDEAKILIEEIKVGGIIYYKWANELSSFEQVKALGDTLQDLAQNTRLGIPLFVAVDQEGGIVSRLTQGFTLFPGNRALAKTGSPNLVRACALAVGQELKAANINMNLAPVVDINLNPRNPIIGTRSFGDDPAMVTLLGKQALEGYAEANMIAVLKHFPGHGDVEQDSHYTLPRVTKSLEELTQAELVPFASLSSVSDAIMTAHLLVPALDPEHCSTLSKKTLMHLRNNLGFDGLIISDSLVMQGILKICPKIEDAAVQALDAGCDLLILGGKRLIGKNLKQPLSPKDIKNIHASIVHAVKIGLLSESRLNDAVRRILSLKSRYLADSTEYSRRTPDFADHSILAKEVASRAIEIGKMDADLLAGLSTKTLAIFAPKPLETSVRNADFLRMGALATGYFFESDLCPNTLDTVNRESDVLIIISHNAWNHPRQEALIRQLFSLKKPSILITTGNPLDAELFSEANLILHTFSPAFPSIEAVRQTIDRPNAAQTSQISSKNSPQT